MEEKSFEDLIEELRTLKIREIEIVAELKTSSQHSAEQTQTREDNRDTEPGNGTQRNKKRRPQYASPTRVRRPASAGPAVD
jgi:hypothetical protein